MTEIPSPHQPTLFLPRLPRWAGYLAACVGMFMAILDIQIVVTALPLIQEKLRIGAENMSWIQTAYIIAEVVAIPLIGLLMRVFSMRWLFAWAIAMFTFASIGCAYSSGFQDLLVWRVLQGFAGGVLIPLVFSGIFLLFPRGFEQTLATTTGGFLAVLAPALGPIAGGWLTEHYSWEWLFLINVGPGIVAFAVGISCLPKARINTGLLASLDWLSVVSFGAALALLVIGLKEAPSRGWFSPVVLGCFIATVSMIVFSVRRPQPAIMYHLLRDRALAFGCVFSFILGVVLFGAVYILPVFLGFVRGHGPLAIGLVTVVMGMAQIVAAPLVVQLDRWFDARLLTGIGFVAFGIGLMLNANLTIASDYNEVFWPQIIRGLAVALCILPPIRMALVLQSRDQVSDASGLFNLARNIGGAIGIALMDTVMFSRAPEHSDTILALISSSPEAAARLLDMPLADLPTHDDAMSMLGIMDVIQSASLTMAINECWWLLTVASFATLPLLLWQGHVPSAVHYLRRGES